MNISDGDLIKLRKDIERVRKHEESRRSREGSEKQGEPPVPEAPPAPAPPTKEVARPPSVPIAVRLRQVLEDLLASPEPSSESLEAIPEHVVTLLQVIRQQPAFERWLLAIEAMPLTHRNQQLEKMSFAFRVEDENSAIAESFDRLKEPSLFNAFCQSLRDEKLPQK
jgi:hypothetical protein